MMQEKSKSNEIESRVEDAVQYFISLFDIKEKPQIDIKISSLDRFVYARPIWNGHDKHVLFFDIQQLLNDARKENVTIQYLFNTLDLIVGEEVGHIMYTHQNQLMLRHLLPESSSTLIYVAEVIGHYCGLIYVNRDDNEIFGLGAESNGIHGEAYKTADRLFERYRLTGLISIISLKNLIDQYKKIKDLESLT